MHEDIHRAAWTESINQCIAEIEGKRVTAQAEFAERLRTARDPNHPFDPDDLPEKPEDPIGDSLCRLPPDLIDLTAEFMRDYLQKLRAVSGDMPAAQAQEYMLSTLRRELRDHLLYGTTDYCFAGLLNMLVELEDKYYLASVAHSKHRGAFQASEFYAPIAAYAEVAEYTGIAVEDMLSKQQKCDDIPEEEWESTPFRVGQRQLIRERHMFEPTNDERLSKKEFEQCSDRGEEVFERMLEPYADVLPDKYCPELPWFIGNLTEHFQRTKQPEYAKRLNGSVRILRADNDNVGAVDVQGRVEAALAKIFLKYLDVKTDDRQLLEAVVDTQRAMDRVNPGAPALGRF